MITITKPKKALVVTTSPVRSSIATSLAKMMRVCSAQLTWRGSAATGRGEDISAGILVDGATFWDPVSGSEYGRVRATLRADASSARKRHERAAHRAHLRLQRGHLLEPDLPRRWLQPEAFSRGAALRELARAALGGARRGNSPRGGGRSAARGPAGHAQAPAERGRLLSGARRGGSHRATLPTGSHAQVALQQAEHLGRALHHAPRGALVSPHLCRASGSASLRRRRTDRGSPAQRHRAQLREGGGLYQPLDRRARAIAALAGQRRRALP